MNERPLHDTIYVPHAWTLLNPGKEPRLQSTVRYVCHGDPPPRPDNVIDLDVPAWLRRQAQ